MPRIHGATAESWFSAAPTSALITTNLGWVGNRFQLTANGRINGIRAYLHTGDSSSHIGLILDGPTGDPLRAVAFNTTVPTSDGWRQVWFRPWLRIQTGHNYYVMVLLNTNFRRNAAALGTPVTHGHITFNQGVTSGQLDMGNTAAYTTSTNANGVDVLFQAD